MIEKFHLFLFLFNSCTFYSQWKVKVLHCFNSPMFFGLWIFSSQLFIDPVTWVSLMILQHVSCGFSLRTCSDSSVWNVLPPYICSANFLYLFWPLLKPYSLKKAYFGCPTQCCISYPFPLHNVSFPFFSMIYPKFLELTLIYIYWIKSITYKSVPYSSIA